ERQTGTGVIAFFGVVGIELLLAPFGIGQGAAVGALDIRHVRSLPHAVQVEHSPGSLGRRTLRRLISTPALARATLSAALTGSGAALARAWSALRLLGYHPAGKGQTHGRGEQRAVSHKSPVTSDA